MKILLIDIPSGWVKGFPKQIPEEFVKEVDGRLQVDPNKRSEYVEWLTEQNGGKKVEGYCRFITEEA
jgi:hypothetical protein